MCIQTFLTPTLHECMTSRQSPVAAHASGAQQAPTEERKWFGKEHAPCRGLASRRELIIFKLLSKHLLVDMRAKRRLCLTCCAAQRAACSGCRAAQKINFQQLFVLWPKNPTLHVNKPEESYRTPTAAAPNVFEGPRNLIQTPLTPSIQKATESHFLRVWACSSSPEQAQGFCCLVPSTPQAGFSQLPPSSPSLTDSLLAEDTSCVRVRQ